MFVVHTNNDAYMILCGVDVRLKGRNEGMVPCPRLWMMKLKVTLSIVVQYEGRYPVIGHPVRDQHDDEHSHSACCGSVVRALSCSGDIFRMSVVVGSINCQK